MESEDTRIREVFRSVRLIYINQSISVRHSRRFFMLLFVYGGPHKRDIQGFAPGDMSEIIASGPPSVLGGKGE